MASRDGSPNPMQRVSHDGARRALAAGDQESAPWAWVVGTGAARTSTAPS